MSKGTISAVSCWVASVQTIPRKGRTQRSASGLVDAAPQRIDFGQGKERTIRGDDLGERLPGRSAGLLDHRDIELALLRVLLDPGVLDAGEPRALEESLHGRLGRADAGTLALLAQGRLGPRKPDHVKAEPARRGKSLRALISQVAVDQRAGDEALEILRRLALHPGRDFFAEQFEEKVGHLMSLMITNERSTCPRPGPLPQSAEEGGEALPPGLTRRRWREAPDEGYPPAPPPAVLSQAAPQALASSRTRKM